MGEEREWNETTFHFLDTDGSVFMLHHPTKGKVDALTSQGCMIIDEEEYRQKEKERMGMEVPRG